MYLPEDGVVQVSTTIELESAMQTNDCGDITLSSSFSQFLLSNVEVVDICSMVLAVV